MSGEGRLENLGKMGNNRDIIVIQIEGGQFRRRISAPTLGTCDASIFLRARPNFRKK